MKNGNINMKGKMVRKKKRKSGSLVKDKQIF